MDREFIKRLLEEFFVLWKAVKPDYLKIIFPFYVAVVYIIGKTIKREDKEYIRRNIWAKFDYLIKIGDFRFISEKSYVSLHVALTYEKRLHSYLSNLTGKVFIDVGSHAGRYSILLSRNFDRILAIEANPYNFSYLVKNIYLNNLQEKIQPLNVALSDKIGLSKLYLSEVGGGTHSLVVKREKYIFVVTMPLDFVIEQMGLKPSDISLVKIDVEGAEYYVLLGMTNLLEKGNPMLVVEIWDDNPKKEDVLHLLSSYGYKLYRVFHEQNVKNYIFIKQK